MPISLDVELGDLHPDDILVELYFGSLNSKQEFQTTYSIEMKQESNDEWGNYNYTGEIPCNITGKSGFLIRILPKHKLQINPYETGKIIWI